MAILGNMADLLADKGASRKALADKKAEAKLAYLSQLNTQFSKEAPPVEQTTQQKIDIIPIRTKAQLVEACRVLAERQYNLSAVGAIDVLWDTYGMRLQLILLNDVKKVQILLTP